MESTLHRQLKALYAGDESAQEVEVDGYRIDVVDGGELIEIQRASLSSIRTKVEVLLRSHRVTVVKPLAARKLLIKRAGKGRAITSKRYSPVRQTIYDLFLELVHFVPVFPHPRLTLEVVLTEQEEFRLPRRKTRFRGKDYRVEDRFLTDVTGRRIFRTADDLQELLPDDLPAEFTTDDIARLKSIPRWLAQKMAYCLRKIEAIQVVGKAGNAMVYRAETDEWRIAS